MKHCSKCGESKALEDFSKDKRRPDGCAAICKACKLKAKDAWRKAKPDKRNAQDRRYSERVLGPIRRARAKAEAARIIRNAEWLDANAALVADIEAWEEDTRPVSFSDRSKTEDIKAYMAENGVCYNTARIQVSSPVRWRFYALREVRRALMGRRVGPTNRVWRNLPFTLPELREHLASMFTGGMSWSNQNEAWQIDHIVPQAALPYDCPEHENFGKVWALSNIRPVTQRANAAKGSRTTRASVEALG